MHYLGSTMNAAPFPSDRLAGGDVKITSLTKLHNDYCPIRTAILTLEVAVLAGTAVEVAVLAGTAGQSRF